MTYYIKATGNNRFAGGTSNWLKIRGLELRPSGIAIRVRIRNKTMYVFVNNDFTPHNLIFAKGWPDLQPIPWLEVKKNARY
jgi:hypothetical protein